MYGTVAVRYRVVELSEIDSCARVQVNQRDMEAFLRFVVAS